MKKIVDTYGSLNMTVPLAWISSEVNLTVDFIKTFKTKLPSDEHCVILANYCHLAKSFLEKDLKSNIDYEKVRMFCRDFSGSVIKVLTGCLGYKIDQLGKYFYWIFNNPVQLIEITPYRKTNQYNKDIYG